MHRKGNAVERKHQSHHSYYKSNNFKTLRSTKKKELLGKYFTVPFSIANIDYYTCWKIYK